MNKTYSVCLGLLFAGVVSGGAGYEATEYLSLLDAHRSQYRAPVR